MSRFVLLTSRNPDFTSKNFSLPSMSIAFAAQGFNEVISGRCSGSTVISPAFVMTVKLLIGESNRTFFNESIFARIIAVID